MNCKVCGRNLYKSFIKFQKEKNTTDNREFFKKEGIIFTCCRTYITTALPDDNFIEKMKEDNH